MSYAGYLKKLHMVGQVDPWRAYDDGTPIMTLLVSVEHALEECIAWSGHTDLTRHEFIKLIRDDGVICFRNVDEFVKLKEKNREEKPKTEAKTPKRKISDEERERRKNQMKSINEKKDPPTAESLVKVT